jgi:transcriptional regulator with XRE-family HTH domain
MNATQRKYALLQAALIAARKRTELTQADVALRLQKPQSFVSKYESGARSLDVIEFMQVCRALGVPAKQILKVLEQEHD